MDRSSDRLVRLVLAALVGSGLKDSELKAVAESFSNDKRFSLKLASLLLAVSSQLEPEQKEMEIGVADAADSGRSEGGLVGLIYDAVQRKRYSKSKLMSAFREAAPSIRWEGLKSDSSVQTMVYEFVRVASTDQTRKLLEILGMETSVDPYFGGISSRRR